MTPSKMFPESMSPDQISAFIAVVQTGSFRSAAKLLNKTQSTISASVKKLEDEIGVTLLDRDHYRPTVTAQGKVFLNEAKEVSKSFAKLQVLGNQLAAGNEPFLSVVLSAICAVPPVLSIIKNSITEYPQTDFSITTEHMSGVIEKLSKGEADIAIGPNIGFHEDHEYFQIGSVEISSVASPGLIPAEQAAVNLKEMRSYVHILVNDSGIESPAKHVNRVPGGKCWYVNDYAIKKDLILASLGWGRMPLHMIKNEIDTQSLQEIEIDGIQNKQVVPIFKVKNENHPTGPVFQRLWDQL